MRSKGKAKHSVHTLKRIQLKLSKYGSQLSFVDVYFGSKSFKKHFKFLDVCVYFYKWVEWRASVA